MATVTNYFTRGLQFIDFPSYSKGHIFDVTPQHLAFLLSDHELVSFDVNLILYKSNNSDATVYHNIKNIELPSLVELTDVSR